MVALVAGAGVAAWAVGSWVGSWVGGPPVQAGEPIAREPAELIAEQDLPADVASAVDTAWQEFLDVFGERRRCFGDVSLLLVSEVTGGDARYDISRARIEIEIPTTPARFRESLVHELAHHVEHTCAEFESLRSELQGLEAFDQPLWSVGESWHDTPSELWAETVVQVVTGERVLHGDQMPLPPGATTMVKRWAQP